MTVAQLIAALQKMNPESTVVFGLQQENKRSPSLYLRLDSTAERHGHEYWIHEGGYGTHITLHLPDKTFIVERKKK